MQLFFFPLSPYSHKVQMSFMHKELSYVPKPINPLDETSSKQVREVYPLGKLPVLKSGDLVIPESSIIVEYLDEIAPAPRLVPQRMEDARAVRLKDRLADFYLSENGIRLFYINLKPEDQRDQSLVRRYLRQITDCYVVIEAMLAENKGDYFHGEQLTLADFSLLPALRITRHMAPFDGYPTLSRYYDKHSQLRCFQEVHTQANEALGAVLAFLKA